MGIQEEQVMRLLRLSRELYRRERKLLSVLSRPEEFGHYWLDSTVTGFVVYYPPIQPMVRPAVAAGSIESCT